MYIIDRLKNIAGMSEPDSSDFILSSFFLNPENLKTEKITLSDVQKLTFISISTINRFCRDCGADSLKNFVEDLRTEFEDERLILQKRCESHRLPTSMVKETEQAAELILKSERIFFYGNPSDINCMSGLQNACILERKQAVILNGWSIERTRRLLRNITEKDCLLLVDTSYSLPMLKLRMDLQEEVIRYHEMTSLPCAKIFIGRKSSEKSDVFMKIGISNESDPGLTLYTLSACLQKRIFDL